MARLMTLKDVRGKVLARFLWKTQSRRRQKKNAAKNARNPNKNRAQRIIISAATPPFGGFEGLPGGGGSGIGATISHNVSGAVKASRRRLRSLTSRRLGVTICRGELETELQQALGKNSSLIGKTNFKNYIPSICF